MEGPFIIIAIVILVLAVFFSVVPVGLWISSMACWKDCCVAATEMSLTVSVMHIWI